MKARGGKEERRTREKKEEEKEPINLRHSLSFLFRLTSTCDKITRGEISFHMAPFLLIDRMPAELIDSIVNSRSHLSPFPVSSLHRHKRPTTPTRSQSYVSMSSVVSSLIDCLVSLYLLRCCALPRAHTHSQADCPFIVCMTYAFHTPDKLCFVLDLMNGGDLHYHLSQHGVFNESDMRFYAAEVILGISFTYISIYLYHIYLYITLYTHT